MYREMYHVGLSIGRRLQYSLTGLGRNEQIATARGVARKALTPSTRAWNLGLARGLRGA